MEHTLQHMQKLLSHGELLKLKEELSHVTEWTKELCVLTIMIDVFCSEAENNVRYSVFDYSTDINELTKHFTQLKLYLRRLDFDLPLENQMEIYDYLQQTNASVFLLAYYLNNNLFYPQKAARRLSDIFFRKEGGNSERGLLFAGLAGHLPSHKDFITGETI